MVLRDLDILSDLARDVEVTVHFTVTTMDETLWRQIEPRLPSPISGWLLFAGCANTAYAPGSF
jgi:DNA repair photolyase